MNNPTPVHFSILSTHLFRTTSSLGSLTTGNNVLPILSDFLFEITPDTLTISASDRHTSVITKVPIQASGNIEIAVPATILIETLRNLPEQPIEIQVDKHNYTLTITATNGQYRIACENHVDFPTISKKTPEKALTINTKSFQQGIKRTFFAASKEEAHRNVCGVNITAAADTIAFVATDGHRLSCYTEQTPLNTTEQSITLPSKALQYILQLLPDTEEKMQILFDTNHCHLWVNQFYIVASIIDATYPDYESVIPEHNPYQLKVQTQALQSAVRIIDCYASKVTHEIWLSLNKDHVVIEAEDMEFSNQGKTKIDCTYTGQPMTIGVNAKLFFELIKNTAYSEEITIHFDTPQKAVLITPSHERKSEKLLMLIMPISPKKTK